MMKGKSMRYRGKRWNNILILAIIAFAVIINLPTLIKTYLIPPAPVEETSFPTLLNSGETITALHTEHWSLENKQGKWMVSKPLTMTADMLLSNWKSIQGTAVSESTYHSLQPNLPAPHSVEVWYHGQEEPQRITYYQTPKFWLFKNWQNKWIAVTVESSYLFPQAKGSQQ